MDSKVGNVPTEDEYKQAGLHASTNALTLCGFSVLTWVLVATVLATASLSNKFFYEIAGGMFLASISLYALAWVLYERVGSAYEIISTRNNPREVLTKQAELSVYGGLLLWTIGGIFLILYLKIYITLIIFLIFLIPVYAYSTLHYFGWRR